MSTEKIVIAKQIYVGFSDRQESNAVWQKDKFVFETEQYVLGFATYYENNAAFRKRQNTINGWSRGLDKNPVTRQPEIFENTPQSGFKISRNVTHGGGWNDLTVYWRIIDPRGFELEITSGNLAKLFQYCNIENGNIHGECVYGFDKGNGSKVVLLPVNSEIYQQSLKSTEIHEAKSLGIKSLNLGDIITLKNGTKGVYLGKQHIIHVSNSNFTTDKYNNGHTDWTILSAQKYLICTIATPEFSTDDIIVAFATPNIIDVEKTSTILNTKEAEIFANNKLIKNGKLTLRNLGTESFDMVICTAFDISRGLGKFDKIPLDTQKIKDNLSVELLLHESKATPFRFTRYSKLIDPALNESFAAEINVHKNILITWMNSNVQCTSVFANVEMENVSYTNKKWKLTLASNQYTQILDNKMEFLYETTRSLYRQRLRNNIDFNSVISFDVLKVQFDNGDGIKLYDISCRY